MSNCLDKYLFTLNTINQATGKSIQDNAHIHFYRLARVMETAESCSILALFRQENRLQALLLVLFNLRVKILFETFCNYCHFY